MIYLKEVEHDFENVLCSRFIYKIMFFLLIMLTLLILLLTMLLLLTLIC